MGPDVDEVDDLIPAGGGQLAERRGESERLLDRQVLIEPGLLRDVADMGAHGLALGAGVVPQHRDLAGVGEVTQSAQHDRRLSGAVRAPQRHGIARRDGEVERVEHGDLAVALGQVANLDHAQLLPGRAAKATAAAAAVMTNEAMISPAGPFRRLPGAETANDGIVDHFRNRAQAREDPGEHVDRPRRRGVGTNSSLWG